MEEKKQTRKEKQLEKHLEAVVEAVLFTMGKSVELRQLAIATAKRICCLFVTSLYMRVSCRAGLSQDITV